MKATSIEIINKHRMTPEPAFLVKIIPRTKEQKEKINKEVHSRDTIS